MENFLNSCWLLLALAALLAWHFQTTQARRQNQRLQFVALLCVLALMFPVISATDDLHPAPQAIEDSSKRTQKAGIAVKWAATHLKDRILPALRGTAVMVISPAAAVKWLQLTTVPGPQVGVRLFRGGRSPPARTF